MSLKNMKPRQGEDNADALISKGTRSEALRDENKDGIVTDKDEHPASGLLQICPGPTAY
jgi:hypothetical protein